MSGYPDDLLELVERYLEGLRFARRRETDALEEAMRYSLLAGGKRLRPVLALATARSVKMEVEEVLPTAAALELIHTYSLIHDDLPAMDDDDLRRGKPTCHVAFGENVAILAGDALYAEAFRLVVEEQRGSAAQVLDVVREIANATGAEGMVGGQFVDVKAGDDVDPAGLRRLHQLKTGKLIAAAVQCVLLLSQLDESARGAYRRFAGEVGVLFQIVDDILDVTGSEEALGKAPGSDERLGKRTYVSVYGLEKARALAAESHRATREALDEVAEVAPGSVDDLRQLADFIHTRTS